MKFCIAIGKETSPTTPLLLAGDFVESMRAAKEMGYDAVEIHTPDPEELDVDRILAACRELDLFIATLGTGMIYGKYGLYLMDGDEARLDRLVEMVKSFIDLAARLGSKVTIGSIKGNVPRGEDRDQCLDRMGRTLQRLDAYAGEKGVTLLLEATNHFENNVINTGKDVYEMISRYQLRHVQALMDTFHINLEERHPASCLSDTGPYLGHIHFGDNTRMYPGSGAFNYDVFCQSIRDVGYDGVLSVECFPLPDGMTAARETMKFFRKYFS